MQQEDARNIILYYKNIPGMIRMFRRQKEDLLSEYDSAKAVVISDMPHGSGSVDTTELFGMQAAEKDVSGRIKQIEKRISRLEKDRELITSAMDALNSDYKTMLIYKLAYDYTWPKLSIILSAPESTLRYRFMSALERLAECLEDSGIDAELVKRASRAR